jgi:tricorn protease
MTRDAMKHFILSCFLLPIFTTAAFGQDESLLLRQPTVSAEHVAFVYAGDIWIADRDGGSARRLTVNPGVESNPMFSPDGSLIAFSGNYDGNGDVYTIPVTGGSPKRLTYHPADDLVLGWTPDGQKILFSSTRHSTTNRYSRFYTVPLEGGFPEPLPMPMAERGSYSPDGTHIAYTPLRDAFQTWKRYRGGRIPTIWLFDLKTYDIIEIPHERASDTNPIWLDNTIYFLSDRNHTMNLFAYETRSRKVRQVTHHEDFDVKSASAGGGVIVYEQGGRLHLFNPKDGTSKSLKIRVAPDLPYTRPHYEKAAPFIRNADLSPTGVRAVFEARGDIFSAPAKKGDIRNLTRTPGVHERDPAWSPDGKWIAYFSDASGEYQLMLREQTGLEEPKVISLGDATFYYSPKWSPDSRKILYTDKRLNLFYLDLQTSKTVLVDTDTYEHAVRSLDPAWSPDSKWITYTKRLDNQLRAVFLNDLATGKSHQLSDGLSDASSACFGLDGKHLFFSASTNYGLNVGWQDMSSYDRAVRRSLYVAVLSKEATSPFAPESDEESADDKTKMEKDAKPSDEAKKDEKEGKGNAGGKEKEQKKIEVRIDLENLDQRIVTLPAPARNYANLQAAADGKLFYLALTDKTHQEMGDNPEGHTLYRFDMKERKEKPFLEKVQSYWISRDGKNLLYRGSANSFGIVKTSEEPKPGEGKLDLARMEIHVDPRAEWSQMFNEAWRIQRDFFYDPKMHGANWPAVREKYRPFLAHVGHRTDVNYIFAEMFGELVVGHAYVSGGDMPETDRVPVGLLGADYEIVDGFYRFKRIYSGENWNPELRAPLTEPGVNVSKGDYLLAVNGRPLKAPVNIYSLFEKTAGQQTVLKVNSKPTLDGARTVTVVPIYDESGLRHRAWVEDNRRKVDEMSKGRVAYVYMPNTAEAGYTYFNRYYFSQLNHEAVVIDERFNGGGSLADYIIDMLSRPVLCYWATRDGKPFSTPGASLYGPKVMIINEYAGSGGDAMPLFFRRRGLGKLVGKRTWGGLVGIYDYPALMDGGRVTAPRMAIFSPDGKWEVENEGVAPDIDVEMTPKLVIEGRDPQLEKAVEVVMKELKQNPVKRPPRPAYPNRVK